MCSLKIDLLTNMCTGRWLSNIVCTGRWIDQHVQWLLNWPIRKLVTELINMCTGHLKGHFVIHSLIPPYLPYQNSDLKPFLQILFHSKENREYVLFSNNCRGPTVITTP